jgi:hypothetical protein
MTDLIGPFEAELWAWQGPAQWVFLTLPDAHADPVRLASFLAFAGPKRGWKLVRVEAMSGGISWQTSLFPDRQSGSYLLPVKAAIRRSLGVSAGDRLVVTLRLLDQP